MVAVSEPADDSGQYSTALPVVPFILALNRSQRHYQRLGLCTCGQHCPVHSRCLFRCQCRLDPLLPLAQVVGLREEVATARLAQERASCPMD